MSLPGIRGILEAADGESDRLWLRLCGATENLAPAWVDPDSGLEVFTDLSGTSAADEIALSR